MPMMNKSFHSYTKLSESVPMSSLMREIFFALHLFKESIFSTSDHLERIVAQFLKVNRRECCDENVQQKYSYQYDEKWDPQTMCVPLCAAAEHPEGIKKWQKRMAK